MKKFLPILLLITGLQITSNAQWVSPGNGTTFTLPDLVTEAHGTVINEGTVFTILEDITIAANDVLLIDDQATRIDAPGRLITINGTITCTNNERVKLFGGEDDPFSMRFENATNCMVRKMYLSDGAGIKLIESDVTFDDVKFVYFTRDYSTNVIDIFNCDPVINGCYFMLNQGPAIGSPANGQASPQILYSEFDTNVDGINCPQINLGPGGDDTIRIIGNEIYDFYATWYAGGISIADLLGVGSTKVLLKNNIIRDGRYGYNQQGQTISSVIVGNRFVDNFHEDNPMNGGSGISIYGTSTDCKALLRDNVITGNLWGLTAIYLHDIDFGTEVKWGRNEIHDNGNSGVVYDLYNNSSCDLQAVGNNWGTTSEGEIEEHIYHQHDDPSLGLVTFIPFSGYDAVTEQPADGGHDDQVTIYNLNGQRMNPESLRSGVYMVVTGSGNHQTVKKIIIP